MKNLIYNTNPTIFHAQGNIEFCPLWKKIYKLCLEKKTIPKDLQIVTFNNGKSFKNKIAGSLEKSIQNQCFVMGKNLKEWKNCFKIYLMVKFLELSKSKYILALDSSDVCIYSFEEIIEKFLQKNCDLLFNAEINCWPKLNSEEAWFKKPFCYLNAGACIAKRDSALDFYRDCLTYIRPETRSEQECVKKTYVKWYPKVLIDDTCSIFQTLNRVDEKMFEVQ